MKEIFLLTMLILYPDSGKVETEIRPVEVAKCVTKDGVRVEDTSCGVRACMKNGHERAAVLWGEYPGLKFKLTCAHKDIVKTQGTGAGGGHPGLKFD